MSIKSHSKSKYKRSVQFNVPRSTTLNIFMIFCGTINAKKSWLYIPVGIIKLKYGEGSEALLKGSFVIPKKLEEEDYKFVYHNLEKALKAVIK